MDQLKPVLKGIVQYRFWIICGITVPLLFGGWYTTTARLVDEKESAKSQIESKYSSGKAILGKTNHPNQHSLEGIDQFVEELKDQVALAWDQMYEQQADILVWPEELEQDFISEVEDKRPIEVVPHPTPISEELRRTLRERYRDYIKEELPKLAEIIGARWAPGSSSGGGGGTGFEGGGGFPGGEMTEMAGEGMMMSPYSQGRSAEEEEGIIVNWNPQDQTALQNSRFDWSNTQERVPKTLDILYAQEDLWVLKALMRIIAQTNYDATGNYNATIKEIRFVNLGRSVGPSAGQISPVGGPRGSGSSGGGGGEGMGIGLGMGSMDMMGSMGMDESTMMSAGADDDSSSEMMGGTMGGTGDPAHNRYVDNDYQPIAADELRSALTSDAKNPANAFLIVAKRIPIRMSMVMDQRRVPRLITACGNSNLMVEVRQVRINKTSRSGQSSMGAGDGGGMMMSSPMGGGFGGFGGAMGGEDGGMDGMSEMMSMGGPGGFGGGSGSSGATPGAQQRRDGNPYDVPVEIYGMVYIYNPVDTDRLGIEQVEAGTDPLESTAPAAESGPAEGEPATGAETGSETATDTDTETATDADADSSSAPQPGAEPAPGTGSAAGAADAEGNAPPPPADDASGASENGGQ